MILGILAGRDIAMIMCGCTSSPNKDITRLHAIRNSITRLTEPRLCRFVQVSEELLPIGSKIWNELDTTIRVIKQITEREDLLGNNPVSDKIL